MKKCSEMSTSFTDVFVKPECKYIIKASIEDYSRINELCNAQLKCFQKLIIDNDLNLQIIEKEADRLGRTHRKYSSLGMKPHFLDLYQSNFLQFLQCLTIEDLEEKAELIEAWKILMNFIVDRMYAIYTEGNVATKEDFDETNMTE
uniref:Globin family profile domain-containing protein n=1 Tax=Panagrolaimus davidi TaxID=227884 RepID=A0A914R5Z4_9BILA